MSNPRTYEIRNHGAAVPAPVPDEPERPPLTIPAPQKEEEPENPEPDKKEPSRRAPGLAASA